jgi:hypothetical protein
MKTPKVSQYYRMLNVPEGSSVETIKQVTKELLKKYHPDLNQSHRQWAETQTKRILEAYQVLVRNPESTPKVITRGTAYKGPIHIHVVEKRRSYMETVFADNDRATKVCIDVNAIERVIPASAIEWVKPQIVGRYLGTPLYMINGLLSLNLMPMNGMYKALFFKKTSLASPQLAYLFKDGGKFIEIKEHETKDFLSHLGGQIELPTYGGNAYLSSQELKALESLF